MNNISKYTYLDYAATASNLNISVIDNFANPNSIHDAGRDSFLTLETSRENITRILNAKFPSEIVFTSSATESNNMAIFGISRAVAKKKGLYLNKEHKPEIIISSIEHDSVTNPALKLKDEGFMVNFVKTNRYGKINTKHLCSLINQNTVLVSIQFANTEIGTVQNIKEVAQLVHKHNVYFHSDCVGAFGKIPINLTTLNLDSASFSGHKIGTSKGIGLFYLKANTPFEPLFYGGNQENGIRSGTQNVALAKQIAQAMDIVNNNIEQNFLHFCSLKNYLQHNIKDISKIYPTVPLDDNKNFLPNIAHFVFDNFSSETLILKYGKFNIQIAGGPACSSKEKVASKVLQAIGVNKKLIYNSLRLSFGLQTTISDIDKFITATKNIISDK